MSVVPTSDHCGDALPALTPRQTWNNAYTRLNDKDRLTLAPYLSVAGLPDLSDLVATGVTATRHGKWKVKGIVLRDVFEKMAKWLNDFMLVGDVLVQYDPAHAAIPWAVLRFALQVLLSASMRSSELILPGLSEQHRKARDVNTGHGVYMPYYCLG